MFDEDFFKEDSVDQLEKNRAKCMKSNCDVRSMFKTLQQCEERVTRKLAYTAENCHQEMCDLMEAVDHCVADRAFLKIA